MIEPAQVTVSVSLWSFTFKPAEVFMVIESLEIEMRLADISLSEFSDGLISFRRLLPLINELPQSSFT